MDRLISNGFSQYDEISEWLKCLGYDVSKSSVHRFGQQLKLERGDFRSEELSEMSQSASSMYLLKMRCVEAAVNSGASDVLGSAKTYLDWVMQD